MKNAMQIVSLFVVSLVLGCSASAQTGKSPVDWKAAYVSGPDVAVSHCDKNKAGEAAYYACLEELDRSRQEQVLSAGNGGAKPPAPTTTAAPVQPPPPAQPTATAPVSPPPLVMGGPVPQQVFIPGAVGPVCETNKALQLVIDNDTDYLIEVRGGLALAPLGCDAQNTLVMANVLRHDGRPAQAWVIPPHVRSIWVFLPLNGGLGRPTINFTAHMPLGCQGGICPPSPAVGRMARQFFVPRNNGQENYQTIAPGYLQMYGR